VSGTRPRVLDAHRTVIDTLPSVLDTPTRVLDLPSLEMIGYINLVFPAFHREVEKQAHFLSLSLIHTLSVSLSLSLSSALARSLSLVHYFSLFLSLSHTHTLSLSLSLCLYRSPAVALSLVYHPNASGESYCPFRSWFLKLLHNSVILVIVKRSCGRFCFQVPTPSLAPGRACLVCQTPCLVLW